VTTNRIDYGELFADPSTYQVLSPADLAELRTAAAAELPHAWDGLVVDLTGRITLGADDPEGTG